MTNSIKMHTLEANGLGQAPFSFLYMIDAGKVQTCCDSCSTGIRYQFFILSHDGKTSKVGIDCIRKLDDGNNSLLNDAERAMAKLEREKKDAEIKAKRDARNAKIEADLESQRVRNGGLTDYEVAENARKQKQMELRVAMTAVNGWLLDVLGNRDDSYGFVANMIEQLKMKPVKELSEKQMAILRDIYAKTTGGRYGSKKYDAAVERFYDLAGVESSVCD